MTARKMAKRGSAVEGGFSYIGAVAVMLVISLIVGVLPTESDAGRSTASFVATAVMQLCFLLAAVLPHILMRSRPTYALSRPTVKAALLAPVVTVVCLVAFYGVATLFSMLLAAVGYESSAAVNMSSPAGIAFAVITSVALAPICEETLFRGSVLSSLGVMFGRKNERARTVLAITLCGLAFAFMHTRPEQTVYQFFFGATLAYMTVRTGSAIPAVIAHMFNNVIGLVLSAPAVGDGINAAVGAISGGWQWVLIAAVASLILAAGGAALLRLMIKRMGQGTTGASFRTTDGDGTGYADDGGTLAGAVFCSLAFAVCLALWIADLVTGIIG